MDLSKTGRLIAKLRQEKGLKQKDIAENLGICAKTVSKWETGHGFPDVSFISELSQIFQVDPSILLEGELPKPKPEVGNIKRTKFYVCEECGNILTSVGNAEIKRKAEVDRLFARMYEDWANERITEYNFNMMSQKYQTEQQELDERIENLETELTTEKEMVENSKKWIDLIKQFSIPTELTAELLNTLIEKIVVHEATKNDMCLNQRKIDIYFRFVGKID